MTYIAELNGNKIKVFHAESMEAIYDKFNTYCKLNNFNEKCETKESVGSIGWKGEHGTVLLKKKKEKITAFSLYR